MRKGMLISDLHLMNNWCHELERMFPDHVQVLHVGSSLIRSDYRDVDIRIVLSDDAFQDLAMLVDLDHLAVALSLWGRAATDLPIDCQVQGFTSQTHIKGPCNGVGIRPELAERYRNLKDGQQ
jgi:hypothetical protein